MKNFYKSVRFSWNFRRMFRDQNLVQGQKLDRLQVGPASLRLSFCRLVIEILLFFPFVYYSTALVLNIWHLRQQNKVSNVLSHPAQLHFLQVIKYYHLEVVKFQGPGWHPWILLKNHSLGRLFQYRPLWVQEQCHTNSATATLPTMLHAEVVHVWKSTPDQFVSDELSPKRMIVIPGVSLVSTLNIPSLSLWVDRISRDLDLDWGYSRYSPTLRNRRCNWCSNRKIDEPYLTLISGWVIWTAPIRSGGLRDYSSTRTGPNAKWRRAVDPKSRRDQG